MAPIEIIVGIDCGKASLDAEIFPGGGVLRVTNDAAGFARLSGWLAAHGVGVAGLEASGGYERSVRNHLVDAGMAVRVLDPARVRHFAKAKGLRAKNDAIDAGMIAEFTATVSGASVGVDGDREALAGLIAARALLVEKRADLIKAMALICADAQLILQAAVDSLKEAIGNLDGQIQCHLAKDPAFSHTADRLRSAPGIGVVTAATLVARLPELGHARPAGIAALVGVAPFDDDSGRHHGQRHIAGGRADVRKALYMATLSATRMQGVIAAYYRRLRASGKKAKVALVACMHKLIVRLNAMLAKGQTWQETAI